MFSASQPLYRPQNVVVLDQAREQVTQSDFTLGIAQQDLIIRTTVAYFDVLLAEFNVELAEQQKIAVSEQLAQAKRNFEVGTATITDTNEAQAKYDQIIATEIQARNDLDRRRTALAAIIGRTPRNLKRIGRGFDPPLPEPNNLDYWVARALRENLNVRFAQSNYEIASLEVDRARAGHLPTLDLVASASALTNSGSTTGDIGGNSRSGAARHRRQRADLHRRLRQLARARDDLAAGSRARRPRIGQAVRREQRAGRLLGREQRGGRREGVRAGGGVGRGRAAVEHPRAGGRHPHQPRRAERPAERLLDAARSRQRLLPVHDRRAAPQVRGRRPDRAGPGRRSTAD